MIKESAKGRIIPAKGSQTAADCEEKQPRQSFPYTSNHIRVILDSAYPSPLVLEDTHFLSLDVC